jgi:hypothetical protein
MKKVGSGRSDEEGSEWHTKSNWKNRHRQIVLSIAYMILEMNSDKNNGRSARLHLQLQATVLSKVETRMGRDPFILVVVANDPIKESYP